MELNFVNGTALQKAACRTVAHSLLNFQFGAIPLIHEVEFTPDPLPSSHNEFAYTTFTYDSNEAFTKIASVAPNWPEPWKGVKFLQETYAHELGHALFAGLSESHRIAIAQMFGAKGDDLEELFPKGFDWEDQIGEGIAETFKDAFLPQRYRRYANRTNHKLSISLYPAFRKLWREASPQVIKQGGESLPAFTEVIQRGSKTHPFLSLETNTFLQELIAACGVTDAIFGPEVASESEEIIQGRRYEAAQILKLYTQQAPYLERLRKEGKDLSVFFWMHAFNQLSPGSSLDEINFIETKKDLPVGTRVNFWFDFNIQVVWRKADGSLYPGDKYSFRYENEEELIELGPENVHPPYGIWENIGTVYNEFLYNDEVSENPILSEHPELDFKIPSDAVAIAGFLIGKEVYREIIRADRPSPKATFYVDVFRARDGRSERLDFSIDGFEGVTETPVDSIVVSTGNTQPVGYSGGTRRSSSRVVGARL